MDTVENEEWMQDFADCFAAAVSELIKQQSLTISAVVQQILEEEQGSGLI